MKKILTIAHMLFMSIGGFNCHNVDNFDFEEYGHTQYLWIKYDSTIYYVNSARDTIPNDCNTL